jgi:3-phenylpropionate/trans-cinnamate dioxygenase ferredoxin component
MERRGERSRWVAAARLADLGDREVHCVFVHGHPIVLVALDGAVCAVDGWCPHRGAWLWEGRVQGDTIRCPLHGFRYDLRSGASAWPGGWDPLPTYETRVRGGIVYVRSPRPAAPRLGGRDAGATG